MARPASRLLLLALLASLACAHPLRPSPFGRARCCATALAASTGTTSTPSTSRTCRTGRRSTLAPDARGARETAPEARRLLGVPRGGDTDLAVGGHDWVACNDYALIGLISFLQDGRGDPSRDGGKGKGAPVGGGRASTAVGRLVSEFLCGSSSRSRVHCRMLGIPAAPGPAVLRGTFRGRPGTHEAWSFYDVVGGLCDATVIAIDVQSLGTAEVIAGLACLLRGMQRRVDDGPTPRLVLALRDAEGDAEGYVATSTRQQKQKLGEEIIALVYREIVGGGASAAELEEELRDLVDLRVVNYECGNGGWNGDGVLRAAGLSLDAGRGQLPETSVRRKKDVPLAGIERLATGLYSSLLVRPVTAGVAEPNESGSHLVHFDHALIEIDAFPDPVEGQSIGGYEDRAHPKRGEETVYEMQQGDAGAGMDVLPAGKEEADLQMEPSRTETRLKDLSDSSSTQDHEATINAKEKEATSVAWPNLSESRGGSIALINETLQSASSRIIATAEKKMTNLAAKQEDNLLDPNKPMPILEFGSDAQRILEDAEAEFDAILAEPACLKLIHGADGEEALPVTINEARTDLLKQIAGDYGLKPLFQLQLQSLREYRGRTYEHVLDEALAQPTTEENEPSQQDLEKREAVRRNAAKRAAEGFQAAAENAVPLMCRQGQPLDGMDYGYLAELEGLMEDMMESTISRKSLKDEWNAVANDHEDVLDMDQDRNLGGSDGRRSSIFSLKPPKGMPRWCEKLAARAFVLGINYIQGWLAMQQIRKAAAERDRVMPKFMLF